MHDKQICTVSSRLLHQLELNLISEHMAFCSNNVYSSPVSKVLSSQMALMEMTTFKTSAS